MDGGKETIKGAPVISFVVHVREKVVEADEDKEERPENRSS